MVKQAKDKKKYLQITDLCKSNTELVSEIYKELHIQLTSDSNCTVRHLSQRTENLYLYKNLYVNVHRNLLLIAPN